ncbi:hypothetical protein X737_35805 [Mesorhizobium sp. L48C026A00]|nr:hypothetical protein X737_35805 [Mesorhizobium sp. L48C026A00]
MVSALGCHGGSLDVLKVAMRPGKPIKIGMIGPMLFAGLPGNPNAALVTFRQIALPAIRRIAGLRRLRPDWSHQFEDRDSKLSSRPPSIETTSGGSIAMASARDIAIRLADDSRPSISSRGRPDSSSPVILTGTHSVRPRRFS